MNQRCHELCDKERENAFHYETEEELKSKLSQGVILKENRFRLVKRFPEGILKEFSSSKAHRMAMNEFKNLGEAFRRGVPSPQPYWIDENRPDTKTHVLYLYMEDLGDNQTLFDVSRQRQLNSQELKNLGLLIKCCIDTGCLHLDMHAGNILCYDNQFKVVDWGKAHFKSGPLLHSEAFKLALAVFSSLEPLSVKEHLTYLVVSFPDLKQVMLERLLRDLTRARQRVWEKHFFSRARKALEESGSWAELQSKPLYICSKEISEEGVQEALEFNPQGNFIKEDRGTRLYRMQMKDSQVLVKEFLKPQLLKKIFKQNKCRLSWMATVQLKTRGIAAPLPLAFRENADGTGKVVMSFLESAMGWDQWIYHNWPKSNLIEAKKWLKLFNQFIVTLLARKVIPGDLKTCNIMLEGEKFYLVDHDAVSFGNRFNKDKKIKMLTQLHLSTPRCVSASDRWRFVKVFAKNKSEAKMLWRAVKLVTQGEKILFQSGSGDVSESQ